MVLKHLELVNFRLHTNTVLKFSDRLNYIVGGNGQGKTTILESIYYLCTTKNLNQALDKEVVSFNKDNFEIKGRFKEKVENKVQLLFSKETNRKNTLLDEKSVTRASDLIGKFPVVTLVQLDHAITMGSPGERRKFIDSVISQSSETYLRILLDYNKTLKQRSQLLSEIRERYDHSLLMQLEAWSESLVKNGSELIKHRINFCNEYENFLKESYSKIMGSKETPGIEYLFFDNNISLENISERFSELLKQEQENEIRRAANLIGPHRDDFLFTINGMELRKYGSQGQHKTFQIALRFGEFFYIKEKQGITPIFLMDDVFGELDTYRAQKISDYLNEIGQAFITMTDFGRLEKLYNGNGDLVIKVDNGTISYEQL
ncbi:MAG: DNA replication and repair protein RecF [Melioribacteraceae bacterium]|nr:DNA replication and repair protein RecF [Melioribacteraceae bacterium]